jgi:Uncharacterised nucleotidyltransferase
MANIVKEQHLQTLSKLVLPSYAPQSSSSAAGSAPMSEGSSYLSALSQQQLSEFLSLANRHHVIVRALQRVQNATEFGASDLVQDWCAESLSAERSRIHHAVDKLAEVCQALENAAGNVTVIKSLDHWPDLGSDIDIYTDGSADMVTRVMRRTFKAEVEPRSWGDRLANKWNFRIPGLQELVEVHVRYLGQTGEQRLMAARVLERSLEKEVNGHTFSVPAPEERILISTLQRMYRHFFFRLCDIANVALLVRNGEVDFSELRRGAELGGIWPGVCGFLVVIARYLQEYGEQLLLPDEVLATAYFPNLRARFRNNFLRLPIGRAAKLYGSQLLSAARRGDIRAITRLPLLPPLAVSALMAYRFTGSDKGVW